MAFFHGITVTEVTSNGVTVQVVNSAVIGLIGSAPQWLAPVGSGPGINKPTLVATPSQASVFGQLVQGYTIPYALDAIQDQGAGAVIVVDVFNPNTHQTTFTSETITAPASVGPPVSLGHMGLVGPGLPNYTIAESTVVVKNAAGSTTYVEGTDYTIDYVNGLLYTKAGTTITASEALKVSGAYCDPSKVVATDIVGTVSGSTYTGIQALQGTFQTMGLFAKLLITPGFTDEVTSAALLAMANKIRAIAFTDAPAQTPVATAIANRGTSGNAFNQASDRLVLCYPQLLITDLGIVPTGVTVSPQGVVGYTYANATVESPKSQWDAGATAAKDLSNGFWFSPSNTPIVGVLGPDMNIYMSAFDPNSDTNNLNAAGIVTIFNAFGTGYRVWGNRASSFPGSSGPTTFICIRRTLDVIEQSIQYASLQFADQPITNGLINSILTSVNAFLRSLVQKGALVAGSSVSYNPADNPSTSLANGQIVFRVNVMPPPPAEQIIYNFAVDTSLLSNLGPTVSSNSNANQVLPTA